MGLRVLLAEDEALVALALADCLEAMGHDVTVAGDGAAALALARRPPGSTPFDLLVTDLNMPRLGGEGLIRALRTERPGLPVVVVTGSAPPGGAGRRRCAGAAAATARSRCCTSRSTTPPWRRRCAASPPRLPRRRPDAGRLRRPGRPRPPPPARRGPVGRRR
jgi:CheY-like chemotaxis protein